MNQLTELYPTIRRYAPNVLNRLMLDALQRAHHKFCQSTGAYKVTRLLSTQTGQSDYDLNLPDKTTVEEILSVREENTDNFVSICHDKSELRQTRKSKKPDNIVIFDYNEVRFEPVPDNEYRFVLDLQLLPQLDATEMDSTIYQKYGDGIAYGAAADLLLMPAEKFFNPQLSEFLERKFKAAKRHAMNDQVNVSKGAVGSCFI
ncbi:hypothetical protein [Agarilytica rhodophyticola]|uniref:phage adaptor protein n=1 Tax=Agarilytica rhodophyticola TaxID=1737490 RepID=UPI000B346634|nr:hypothetical protein [Agarilytica rhodophyticola]